MRLAAMLLLLIVYVLPARSQWIPLDPSNAAMSPAVTLLEDSPSATTVRIDIPGFESSVLTAGGKNYTTISLHTESRTMEPGRPEVPYVPVVLAIPDQGDVTVEVVQTAGPVTFQDYYLPPARPTWKEGDPEPGYVESEASYHSTTPYPAQRAGIGKPAVFRDFRIVRLEVYPVRYAAATAELTVVPSVTVRLKYGSGPGLNPRTGPHRAIAPSFDRLYRSLILNYDSRLTRTGNALASGRDVMLVITPDTFATSLKPYVLWKHQSGIYTVVKKFSEIGANSSDPSLIKNYILNAYNTWTDPPTYILLVGDDGVVPISLVSYDYTFANEDYFVELAGDDFFPEMFIGRFTHETDYGLRTMTNKFLMYEQTPYTANQQWFRKAVVGSNNYRESQVTTKRFTADVMRTDGGFLSVDTMMSSAPCVYDVNDVIAAINNGRSYLNYRGEGWSDGWHASCLSFYTSDVSSVNNGQMFTFVTSIGCGVTMFNVGGGNCFGEQWVEMGTPTSPRGACAFVGPTSNTRTIYNDEIDKGIYIGMFREGMETPGEALLRGKLHMYSVFGNVYDVEYHSRIYCVLGDPSIHIWRHTPAPASVTVPAGIPIGNSQVQVVVRDSATLTPSRGITVCITGDSVYAVDTTDVNGIALLNVTLTTLDTLCIVARGNTIIPFRDVIFTTPTELYVAPSAPPVIVDLDGNLDSRVNPNEHCRVSVSLKNWGTQTATDVTATLSSPDTTLVHILAGSPASFGNIAPGATASSTPFEIFVEPGTPVGQRVQLALHTTSGTSSWNYTVNVDVKGCILSPITYLVNDQGSPHPNARLDPGETAILSFTVRNEGEDRGPGVTGILRSTDPHLIIQDSIGFFGMIDTASSATNLTDSFVLTISDSCPSQYTLPLTLVLTTSGGYYPYSVDRGTSVAVGTPVPMDPTGPDVFGYYAYASDDSAYEQSPEYQWVEIDGVGTIAPRDVNGDTTITVALPFPFKYYGVSQTQLRISCDGWIAFSAGTGSSWVNYPLPHSDNVAAMAAPFWDDLFGNIAQETGKLLYYYDAINHRYIVEWHEVGHWSRVTDRETFQVILFDPAYYPTNTGNGDILFQYQVVADDGSMTLGIENPAQNGALQYAYNDTYAPTAANLKDLYAVRFTTELPTISSPNTLVAVPIHPGWNLIAHPVLRPDSLSTVLLLYPHSSLAYAFAFDAGSGYTQQTLLSIGRGYWGKFPSEEINTIVGGTLLTDTLNVQQGWNIIGSISTLLDTAEISTVPAGIRSSIYFGYSGGYVGTEFITPGQGYWVKASAPGVFVLRSTPGPDGAQPAENAPAIASLHQFTVADNEGHGQKLYFGSGAGSNIPVSLYAMPPAPPAGAFDCRFETSDGGAMMQVHDGDGSADFPIAVHAASYPLTVSWELSGEDEYLLFGKSGSELIRLAEVHGTGRLTVANSSMQNFVLRLVAVEGIPRAFALEQNYPNPFNPSTSLRFALPVQSLVKAEVYNALGQRVRTVVDEVRKAGYHTVVWDGRGDRGQQLGSGTYFLRMDARGADGASFTATRKLLLIK
jgi:hypothetical protein